MILLVKLGSIPTGRKVEVFYPHYHQNSPHVGLAAPFAGLPVSDLASVQRCDFLVTYSLLDIYWENGDS
jgi:hypothetical protein